MGKHRELLQNAILSFSGTPYWTALELFPKIFLNVLSGATFVCTCGEGSSSTDGMAMLSLSKSESAAQIALNFFNSL